MSDSSDYPFQIVRDRRVDEDEVVLVGGSNPW